MPDEDPRRARSALVCAVGEPYLRRYFRRNFNAVRVAHDGSPAAMPGRALIVCANHPSWWDPMMFALLTRLLFRGRAGYGPMEAAALGRYGVLRRIGVFGIGPGRGGAARFLRVGLDLLADPATVLWITAEGAFTDPRTRPVRLRPGLAHLTRRGVATVLPLAMEFPFWNERRPEALIRFGPPVEPPPGRDAAAWTEALEAALTASMDALAEAAISRDPSRFVTLLRGRTGVGGIYDAWRRGLAWGRGRRFDPSHGGEAFTHLAGEGDEDG